MYVYGVPSTSPYSVHTCAQVLEENVEEGYRIVCLEFDNLFRSE